MSHFAQLLLHTPDLRTRSILDLGAGKGGFVLEAVSEGADIQGVEYNPAYIQIADERLNAVGSSVRIVHGSGERLPYADGSFGFINMSEVIEHVQDPERVISEVYRVLQQGGAAYISVPNRFGMRDPHYKLFFVNWVPRAWATAFISIFGNHKHYEDSTAGIQRLDEMHYYTFRQFKLLAEKEGFSVTDIRLLRVRAEYPGAKGWIARIAYAILRPWYFDSFHILVRK